MGVEHFPEGIANQHKRVLSAVGVIMQLGNAFLHCAADDAGRMSEEFGELPSVTCSGRRGAGKGIEMGDEI